MIRGKKHGACMKPACRFESVCYPSGVKKKKRRLLGPHQVSIFVGSFNLRKGYRSRQIKVGALFSLKIMLK